MVLISSPSEDKPDFKSPLVGAPAAPAVGTEKKQGSEPDAAMLAFLYLIQAATAAADSAAVRAKQLNSNALAQEKLNNQISNLKWASVEKEQKNQHKHTVRTKTVWTHGYWWDCWIPIPHHKKYYKWTNTIANKTAIAEEQSQNQMMFASRAVLQDKLTVLQQTSTVSETGVSTQTQESMQSMQEGSSLLSILQDLTYKALLHQPPRG